MLKMKSQKVTCVLCLNSNAGHSHHMYVESIESDVHSAILLYEESFYIKFNLGLNAAKNAHQIRKSFKQKLCEIEFCTKKSTSARISISHRSGTRGLERLIWLKHDFVLRWQNTFNLGLNTTKIRIKSKKYKLLRIKFHTRRSMSAHVYLLRKWS